MTLDGVEIYGADVTTVDASMYGTIYHEEGAVVIEDLTVRDSNFNIGGNLWGLIYTE